MPSTTFSVATASSTQSVFRSATSEAPSVAGSTVPASAPASMPKGSGAEEPKHPCELITVMRVPCDPATATCEYTYWECPRHVNPLRA